MSTKLEESNDIQHALEDQIRMREGAMKLMSACSTLNQALETSKNLVTINARILGLMSGLQRQKEQHVLEEYNRQRSSVCMDVLADCCTGRIAMSDVRVPLMWKDNVHFTGKTGDQSYYAFALIRCGDQVRDTPLCEITSADTDMYFAEALIFDDLLPDFKMDFEIYYTVLTTAESVPILRAPRASISIRSSSRRQAHFNAPKFCLAGHVQLGVDDVRGCMISKDLAMGGKGASGVAVLGDITEFPIHPLELWGQICCQLAAQPRCMLKKSLTSTQIKVEEEECWCEYYAELHQCKIQCWKDSSLAEKTAPNNKVIQLNEDMEVSVPDTGGGTDILELTAKSETLHTLQFLNNADATKWKCALRKEIHNFRFWKAACKEIMHIEEYRKSRISTPSNASFYDKINIGDEPLIKPERSLLNGDSSVPILLQNDDEHSEDVFNTTSTTSPVPPEQKFPDSSSIISPKEKDIISVGTAAETATVPADITTSNPKPVDTIVNNDVTDEDAISPDDDSAKRPRSDVVSIIVSDADVSDTTGSEKDDDNEEMIVHEKIDSIINDISEKENKNQDKEASKGINGELCVDEGKGSTNVEVVDTNGHIDDACGNSVGIDHTAGETNVTDSDVPTDPCINVKTDITNNVCTDPGKKDIVVNDAVNHTEESVSNGAEITNELCNSSNEVHVDNNGIVSETTDAINDTTNTSCSTFTNETDDNINNNAESLTDNDDVKNGSDEVSASSNTATSSIENNTNTNNDSTWVLSNENNDVSNHNGKSDDIHTTPSNTESITDDTIISVNATDTNSNTDEVSVKIDNITEKDNISNDTDAPSDNKDSVVDNISTTINATDRVHNDTEEVTSEITTDTLCNNVEVASDNNTNTCITTDETNVTSNVTSNVTETDTIINDETNVTSSTDTEAGTIINDETNVTSSVASKVTETDTIINDETNVTSSVASTDTEAERIINDSTTNTISNNTDAVSDNCASSDITEDTRVNDSDHTLLSSGNAINSNADSVVTNSDKLVDITHNKIALNDETITTNTNVISDNSDDIRDNSVVTTENSDLVNNKSAHIDDSHISTDNLEEAGNKVDVDNEITDRTNDSSSINSDVNNDITCTKLANADVIHDETDAIDKIDPDLGADSIESNGKDVSSCEDEKPYKESEEEIVNKVGKEVEG